MRRLSESERIDLDRREFALSITREIERIQSQPLDLSIIQSGKHQAESQLRYLAPLLEVATPEQKPVLEAEIARQKAQLARCVTELDVRPDEFNVQRVPPETPGPNEPQSIPATRNLVDPEASAVPQIPGRTAATLIPRPRELGAYRRAILKAFMRKKELDGMDALSRHLGCSRTQLYGMARGDKSRYSDDRLNVLLGRIECTRARWDNESPLTSGA
jgi:hypothetical protein